MGRYQRVTVLGEASDPLPVSSEGPQGSILCPILFLVYVNSLLDSVLTNRAGTLAVKNGYFFPGTLKSNED